MNTVDLIKNRDQLIPTGRYEGIYRAVVVDNIDPEKRARLKINIPAIHPPEEKANLPWADCCTNVAGNGRSNMMIPKKDDVVFIMFEMADPHYPVWIGSWFASPGGVSELPTELQSAVGKHYVIKTDSGHSIDISDETGKVFIDIKTAGGNHIKLDDTGAKIDIEATQALAVINIKPSTVGSVNIGNTPIMFCNDLPVCPILGAHYIGTSVPGNIVKVP